MKLNEIGEFGFIKEILEQKIQYQNDKIIGIGDDCAVIEGSNGICQIVTTDMLIEGSHFLLDKISAFDLGYKSLAVNLSDIAAMGGCPLSAFISLGIPEKISVEWLKDFYQGMQTLAEESGTMILGGDTTKSLTGLVINVAVIGQIKRNNLKLRSDAKVNDLICVTGNLGDSAAGLKLILDNIEVTKGIEKELFESHIRPRPHLSEGQWLAQFNEVHAMMDISDGIDSDLHRIMEKSNIGIEVYLELLPISESLDTISRNFSWDKFNLAVAGGEDYCLLCTVDKDYYKEIDSEFKNKFGHSLYQIGKITNTGDFRYYNNGKHIFLGQKGYDHFNK